MSEGHAIGLDAAYVTRVVAAALAEDVGPGDVTTLATIPAEATCEARLNTRATGVICGLPVAVEVFRQLDRSLDITTHRTDGEAMEVGDLLLTVRGAARAVLTAERVALNFAQRLSGIATITARYVELVRGTQATIV